MQDRLTIDLPYALRDTLADAVRSVCARDLAVTPAHLDLLDARLACGDFESVLALLRQSTRTDAEDAALPAALPLFVARYLRWTGDLHSAAAIWQDVLAALEIVLRSDGPQSLLHATGVEFAPVATDLGDMQLAARLHGIVRAIRPTTAGTYDDGGLDDDIVNRAGAKGRAAVDDRAGADVARVCDIAFNTIGIDPDASRGRLRLRPRLDLIDNLHVRSIRFGDGSISLRAERTGQILGMRVVQDAGSMPITVLLEPFVIAPGPATVDGRKADLVPRSVPGGTILPVQLVLDEERMLVVHMGAEGR